MKRYVSLVFLFLCLSALIASESRDLWTDDFALATKMARELNRPILINFTGSDWCRWCVLLEDEVFSQPIFKEYAKENLVLFIADFPRNISQTDELKQQNQYLMTKYGVRGFPTIVLVDKNENVLATTGYRRGGAENYVKHIIELLK